MITTKKVEELGFTLYQTSSWSRDDLSRMSMTWVPHPLFTKGYISELVIGEQDVWQLFIGEEDKVKIVHATVSDSSIGFLDLEKGITDKRKMMQFSTVFAGKIKSDDDLVKALELVECPFKPIKKQTMTKVKVEFFKHTGKFYSSFEYESDIPAFDMLNLVKEVKNKPLFIKEMSFTIEVDQGEKGWNKWLFVK